jgi:gamma-butyrobetaine dioxygenase
MSAAARGAIDAVVLEMVEVFATRGAAAYLGEPVSMSEHMCQTARLAATAGAPSSLVAAALLHDVGHLVHDLADDAADHGIDTDHEHVGAVWLERRGFGPAVTEPVRLHVAAKRFLCAVEPAYLAELSAASIHSLHLQGGPMTPAEADEFRRSRWSDDAVAVRRWDDRGKSPDDPLTPTVVEWVALLRSVLGG